MSQALAAIDIGSNAMRLRIEARDRTVLADARVALRLGHDVFRLGRLSEQTIDEAVQALAEFERRMARHDVAQWRAVATSAVRDSANGAELVERVRAATGISIETIDAAEEARLVFLAVRRAIDLHDRSWLLVDLGGGSLEISVIAADGIRQTESHPLGAVRLLEAVTSGQADLRTTVPERLAVLDASPLLTKEHAGLIATGGNIDALALVLMPGQPPPVRIALATLDRAVEEILARDVDARIRDLGFRPERADVVAPAALVYQRIAQLCGADTLIAPMVGVKEGIIAELT